MTELTKITMPGEIYASGSTVAGNACVCGPQSPFGTQPINTLADLQHALSHVYMRFDTDPRSYSKKDYYYLLWVISRGLVHLYENEANPGQQGDVQEQLIALQKLATELGEKYNQMVPVVTQLEKDVVSLKAADVSARVQENSDDIDVLEGNVLDKYQYPGDDNMQSGSILRLTEYLHYHFKNAGYQNIAFYDKYSIIPVAEKRTPR